MPDAEWMVEIPHHFIGSQPLERAISAGEYGVMGRETIARITSRGRLPIVVGGSGLYVRALIEGLSPTPPASPELREQIKYQLATDGFAALYTELQNADPEYASIVSETTPKRLIRALEVQRLTGKSFSGWHREQKPPRWCRPLMIGLERPRAELREIIDLRTRAMVASGWLAEVETLLKIYGTFDHFPPPANEAVGYRLLAEVIKGVRVQSEAIDLIITSTRQFAKRQMTWFRANPETVWLLESGASAPQIWAEQIIELWRSFARTTHEVK